MRFNRRHRLLPCLPSDFDGGQGGGAGGRTGDGSGGAAGSEAGKVKLPEFSGYEPAR